MNQKTTPATVAESAVNLTPVAPRYPKPKVLLLDLKDDSGAVLREAGYNVHQGTLGTPYLVPKSNSYRIVPKDYRIPNYAEQEIVVLDLAPNKLLKQATSEEETVEGNLDYWAKCNHGEIDPRPIASKLFQTAFDLILNHGGVFVIFADYASGSDIVYARSTARNINTVSSNFRLWSFLTTLDNGRFRVEFQEGKEIQIAETSSILGKVINRHLTGATFSCIFGPQRYVGGVTYDYNQAFDSWLTLATDKYGSPVAGVIKPHRDSNGWVFILPQIQQKSQFILDLFRDVLSEFVPGLFPYAESKQWIEKDEYQMSNIIEIRHQISSIEAETAERILQLERRIIEMKEQTGYLRHLLTETGDTLVRAVQTTLQNLGFASVMDVDEELKKSGEKGGKREDLRVIEGSSRLLVEVKGINGLPADTDALQVNKYVVVRMREWGSTDVQGLGIINHQRGVPPLERENAKPFRDDILVNAEDEHFGLMTSWDLYRLARSFLKFGWKFEQVKPIFWSPGRIEGVPAHYRFVGTVEHFWDEVSAVGIRLESGEINQGDKVAFAFPIEYEEQITESLQIDNKQVTTARAPDLVGIRTPLTKHQLRRGTRVYRVDEINEN